jgi:hypothetical protein
MSNVRFWWVSQVTETQFLALWGVLGPEIQIPTENTNIFIPLLHMYGYEPVWTTD